MAFFDMPLDQLQTYAPPRNEPADFDAFWQRTLDEARQFPLDAQFVPVDAGLRALEAYDVTFRGYGGQAIKGWFILPKQRTGSVSVPSSVGALHPRQAPTYSTLMVAR